MTDLIFWHGLASISWLNPLVATATEAEIEAESGSLILAGVLLSLVIVYFASKLGGEICARIDLPPVLGELVGGVLVGVSAFNLLVFPEAGSVASDSLVINFLQQTAGLTPEATNHVFASQSEVISLLSELGVRF